MSSFCMSMGVFDWLVGPTQRFFVQSKERPMISLSASVETSTALKITGDKYYDHHIDDNNSIPTECLPIVAPAVNFIPSTSLPQQPLQAEGGDPTADDHGGEQSWYSGVKIVECRYLAQSGCKALCLHLCKAPTQEFFLQELGMPLYMKPDFTNNSCEMRFGVLPPKEEDDPAFQEACFSSCFNNFKIKATKSHKGTSSLSK